MDVPTNVADLHDLLLKLYVDGADTIEEYDTYVDMLKLYTTAVMRASTEAVCELMGIDPDRVAMLELTEAQYHRLVESDMIDVYIDGKDETDD